MNDGSAPPDQTKTADASRAYPIEAGVASFIIPGLGQAFCGRSLRGLGFFVCSMAAYSLWISLTSPWGDVVSFKLSWIPEIIIGGWAAWDAYHCGKEKVWHAAAVKDTAIDPSRTRHVGFWAAVIVQGTLAALAWVITIWSVWGIIQEGPKHLEILLFAVPFCLLLPGWIAWKVGKSTRRIWEGLERPPFFFTTELKWTHLAIFPALVFFLAAIAVPEQFKVVERGKASEALATLDTLRSAQERYRAQTGRYCGGPGPSGAFCMGLAGWDLTVPTMKYFSLGTPSTFTRGAAPAWSVVATRNASPQIYGAYAITYSIVGGAPTVVCSEAKCQQDLMPQ